MSKIRGKLIFDIPVSTTIEYVVRIDDAEASIAAKYGAKFVEYRNEGQPQQWAAGIGEAISEHANVIVLAQGIPLQELVPELRKAKAAGIPVVSTKDYQIGQQASGPPNGPGNSVKGLIAAYVNDDFWGAMRLAADYIVATSNGNADVLIFSVSDTATSPGMVTALKSEFANTCPKCKLKVVDAPISQWTTNLSSLTQTALAADPNIKWIVPIYDSMSLFIQQGVQAAGRAGKTGIVSFNGTLEVMKLIENGDIMTADVGESAPWLAYAAMDQIGDEKTPLRVFDKSNIKQVGTPPQSSLGYGTSYMSGYHRLWSGP
jgi:ribose transport system substrate-binding protein